MSLTTLREYWLIPALAFGIFGVSLMIYAGLGGNPLNQLAYSAFAAGVPALIAFSLSGKLRLRRLSAAVVYLGFFALIVVLQGVIRKW